MLTNVNRIHHRVIQHQKTALTILALIDVNARMASEISLDSALFFIVHASYFIWINDFGWEGRGGRTGGRGGRKILLYLIMYRKYVPKWWLLKRNRIIWPELAVHSQFKSKFSVKSPKIEIFRKFALNYQIFLWNYLKKSKFFGNLPWKIDFLWNCKKSKFFGKFNRKSNFLGNCLKNQNSSEICLEKSKFFMKLP